MLIRRAMLLAGLLSAGGCYRYLPATPQEIVPGQSVRLLLTSEEAGRYTDLRLVNPRVLTANVVDRSGSELMLETTVGVNDRTTGSRALMQRLNVPLAGIADIELREMDKGKTGFLVGGGAVLFTALIVNNARGSGSDKPGGGETTDARRVPWFRFSLPF